MILLGTGQQTGKMKYHLDDEDYITSVVTFGSVNVKSGSKVYFDEMDSKFVGNIQQAISFHHGRIQIGNYDNFYHGVSPHVSLRFTIVYYMKKKLLDHFLTYGNHFYAQYVQSDYPSHDYIAS